MNSWKKIVNELRFQLDSKEVKDQHYPVQLSASDANAILAMLTEQDAVKPFHKCIDKAFTLIEDSHFDYYPYCGKVIKWND